LLGLFRNDYHNANPCIDSKYSNSQIRDLDCGDNSYDNEKFEKKYFHSEQWLIAHLMSNEVLSRNYDNLISRILENETIDRAVLLIHSNRDCCKSCAQSISVFSEKFFKNFIREKQIKQNAKYLDPLVIVSSRTEFNERRSNFGFTLSENDLRHQTDVKIDNSDNDPKDPNNYVKHVIMDNFPEKK
jgi:hypothetical protein